MASASRALLVAGALLASASLAQAGDKGAFADSTQDARADLRPIVKPAPDPDPVLDGAAATPLAPPKATSDRKASHRRTRFARRVSKAVAVAALKATFPSTAEVNPSTAKPDSQPAATTPDAVSTIAEPSTKPADTNRGQTEAAAPTPPAAPTPGGPREPASGTLSELLEKHARANGVPLKLAEAVVTIESRGNVRASHAGALGLMQIKYGTARAAGFSGPAVGLFAADTNLRFGMKILGDAYRAAGGDTCGALMRYQSGHYATHMNNANRAYCSKARALMAGA